ncbi:MAG: cyclase family protein [bacterium]|nr:cyclase family protein [bacterium]
MNGGKYAHYRFINNYSTHVDAPWHYNSKIQEEKAPTIDQLPLEWFFSDGVVFDMSHKEEGLSVEEYLAGDCFLS